MRKFYEIRKESFYGKIQYLKKLELILIFFIVLFLATYSFQDQAFSQDLYGYDNYNYLYGFNNFYNFDPWASVAQFNYQSLSRYGKSNWEVWPQVNLYSYPSWESTLNNLRYDSLKIYNNLPYIANQFLYDLSLSVSNIYSNVFNIYSNGQRGYYWPYFYTDTTNFNSWRTPYLLPIHFFNSSKDDTPEHVQSDLDFLQSERIRNISPYVEDNELDELVIGNTTFALDLYRALCNEDINLFYSPYSISLALAMTYAGARNETEIQIKNTLHFTLPQERLHPTFNALDLELSSTGESANDQDGKEFRLNITNSLWGQKDYSFLTDFLDVIAENYGAGLRLVDFIKNPEQCRLIINDWVSDQTESKIEDLIPFGEITDLTRLVLVNAIYFNAAWKNCFQEEFTRNDIFYTLDGNQIIVPMMSMTSDFGYSEGENYQAIELLYYGEESSMVIILPSVGHFKDFESSLDTNKLTTIIEDLEQRRIQLSMPKFTYTSDTISIKDVLSQMGMPNAFVYGLADFSGMDGTYNLFISNVLHKAFISVNEAGTEAAAATAVIIGYGSLPPQVTINRPFIFFIRDINTNTILFVGRIINPTG